MKISVDKKVFEELIFSANKIVMCFVDDVQEGEEHGFVIPGIVIDGCKKAITDAKKELK